jgi:signal peptidase I
LSAKERKERKEIMNYFKKRRIKKNSKNLLRHADHFKNIREDLMSDEQLKELADAKKMLQDEVKSGNIDLIERAGDNLAEKISILFPQRSFPGIRENIEVIVVAVAVAMAFRSYFLQPFKIPTGSMQPTLYGIISETVNKPTIMDKVPLNALKWITTGKLYRELKVEVGGTLDILRQRNGYPYVNPSYPGDVYYSIAGHRYRIPRTAVLKYRVGDYVEKGAILWSGIRTAGDHIFVDKVSWNFRKPNRGEIMVFTTTGIKKLEANFARDRKGKIISTHYIKRMCGVPGDKLSINPPKLFIEGKEVMEPDTIRREIEQRPGYAGYQLAPGGLYLTSVEDTVQLKEKEYWAMGDNTRNSRDSRYWGPVPAKNLVGPAALVYWPFSKRWGRAK